MPNITATTQEELHLGPGADPYIINWHDTYYFIESEKQIVTIRRSKDIEKLCEANREVVWEAAMDDISHKKQLWAPELHFVNGHWLILVAASSGRNPTHRSVVLKSQSDSPMGPYKAVGKATPKDDLWSIDMTYLEHNGELFAVWSGWEVKKGKNRQNIYIAKMDSPFTICSDRVCISIPQHTWETSICAINEGPQILKKEGELIGIVYSANASWTHEYCQGLLKYKGGNPLDHSNWEKHSEPISDYNVGHLSFFKHCSTGEDWVAYHTKTVTQYGWKDRVVKLRPIDWTSDNLPNLRFSSAG